MNRTLRNLASALLSAGVLFTIAGLLVDDMSTQNILSQVGSLGLTSASVLLAAGFFRTGNDYVAAGFFLLALAGGVMSGGTASGMMQGQPAFGAGMSLYVPALLSISAPVTFPLWARFAGMGACLAFAIAAGRILLGELTLPTSPIPLIGTALLAVAIAGWIRWLRRGTETTPAESQAGTDGH